MGMESFGGLIRFGLPFDLGNKDANDSMGRMTSLAQRFLGGATGKAASEALSPDLLTAGGDAVTAHPHIDPKTNNLIFYSYQVRPKMPRTLGDETAVSEFKFFEISNTTGEVVHESVVEYSLPGFAFAHDFLLTDSYFILFQNPVVVDNLPYLLGLSPAAACVRWIPSKPTVIHLIPRPNASKEILERGFKTFNAPPTFVFHHANAYEMTCDNSGRKLLVIDSIHYDSLPAVGREASTSQSIDPDAAFTSRLCRINIDMDLGVLNVNKMFDGYLEMPSVSSQVFSSEHRYVYGYHSIFEDPQIAIAKVDVKNNSVDIWKPGKNRFALDPQFAPRITRQGSSFQNEDNGYIIAQIFDSELNRSEIVILDAADILKGPVAVLALREPLPSAIHSFWASKYYGPQSLKSVPEKTKSEDESRCFGISYRRKACIAFDRNPTLE